MREKQRRRWDDNAELRLPRGKRSWIQSLLVGACDLIYVMLVRSGKLDYARKGYTRQHGVLAKWWTEAELQVLMNAIGSASPKWDCKQIGADTAKRFG